ncbi:MAG: hypothetical protein K2Y23_01005 [Cyanobacteria bacterium]|nr:hypothetical protein [Cyanobacteriota bacterium]
MTRLICAIVTGSLAALPITLPQALQAHFKDERFQIVTSIRGLPLGVRDELQELFGGSLDIAEPGAPLKSRRLVAAGCSIDHCLVYYERGAAPSWRVALFHWTPAATTLDFGGHAPGGFRLIEEVRNAVLSGAINGAESW